MVLGDLGVADDLLGQVYQGVGQRRHDLTARLRSTVAGDVEEEGPIHRPLGRDTPTAQTVREDRHLARGFVEAVGRRDLGVAEAVGGVGELDRYLRRSAGPFFRLVEPPTVALDVGEKFLPHRELQELVGDDPLVVPLYQPARLVEDVVLWYPALSHPVDHAVVELQEGQVQLGDQEVDVVPGVADEGLALVVAGQVFGRVTGFVYPEQQLVRVVRVVEERVAHRTVPVDALEVEPGGAGVAQFLKFLVRGQERPVGRYVVGDELAEDRKTGGDAPVFQPLVRHRQRRVHARGGSAQADHALDVRLQFWQLGEHAPVLAAQRYRAHLGVLQ